MSHSAVFDADSLAARAISDRLVVLPACNPAWVTAHVTAMPAVLWKSTDQRLGSNRHMYCNAISFASDPGKLAVNLPFSVHVKR